MFGLLFPLSGCGKTAPAPQKSSAGAGPDDKPDAKLDFTVIRPKVEKFCGDCHLTPRPDTFPKRAWYKEVAQGYKFYETSGRNDLDPPLMSEVVAYYRHHAPEELELNSGRDSISSQSAIRFEKQAAPVPEEAKSIAVSHFKWVGGPNATRELLFCDMRGGDVRRVKFTAGKVETELIARLQHPAHVERHDFDGDGRLDYLVADLGSFPPEDHQKGRVLWLRARENGDGYETVVLKAGIGRACDVRPGDFDGDGDTDLVVAEFGWRKTGRILLLTQSGVKAGVPQFETTVIDKRHGTIHVPTVDLNGDGRLDFIALISQEYETVEAFLNRGDGTFEKKTVLAPNDPSYGSSGIELADVDGDGDLDIVYTNGDSLDSFYLKPTHAIHWLENTGSFPFQRHEIAKMPGVSRAVAADVDGDGDIDIVAAAYLPPRVVTELKGQQFESLAWFEQRKPGEFVRHRLQQSAVGHLALDAGDFDGDGRIDLAVGNHEGDSRAAGWFSIWRNRPAAGARKR